MELLSTASTRTSAVLLAAVVPPARPIPSHPVSFAGFAAGGKTRRLQNILHSAAAVLCKPPPVLMQARTHKAQQLPGCSGRDFPEHCLPWLFGVAARQAGRAAQQKWQINGTDVVGPRKLLAKPLLHTPRCVAAASALLGSAPCQQPRPPRCAWSFTARPVPASGNERGRQGKCRARKWEMPASGLEREAGKMCVSGGGTG